MTMSKGKISVIVIAIILIISCSVVGYMYYLLSSSPLELTGLTVTRYELKRDGVYLEVMTIPPEHSGDATLNIGHGTDSQTGERTITIGNGYWQGTIPYNEFVSANGEYTVTVAYKGLQANQSFDINFIVEDLTVLATAVYDEKSETPKISMTVPLSEMSNVTVSIDILDDDGESFEGHENELLDDYDETYGGYVVQYPYQTSGNYTIRAAWRNNNAMPGFETPARSPKSTTFLINLLPTAVPRPLEQDTSIKNDGGWAYFYGGNSTDYDDAAETLSYIWYFDTDNDETQVDEHDKNDTRTGRDTSYQYTENDLGGHWPLYKAKDHYVTLEVRDRWWPLTSLSDVAVCTVTVNP